MASVFQRTKNFLTRREKISYERIGPEKAFKGGTSRMTIFSRRTAFLLPIAAPVALMARPIPAAAQDRELLALGARFDEALTHQKQLESAAEFGGPAEHEAAMEGWPHMDRLTAQIGAAKAQTILGLQVKARAALFWSEPRIADWDPVALSVVKDLLRLPG